MAFAIWVGACTFEFVTQVVSPDLGLDDGDRIVGLHIRDVAENETVNPTILDLAAWRGELDTVDDLGGWRGTPQSFVTERDGSAPVIVAEIGASAFRVVRTPPLMGRTLVQADENPAAPPVAVIGYDLWQRRFGGAADVVGSTVRIGSEPTTVVGVMPEGFGFPINHSVWVPLRLNPLDYARGAAPDLRLFGRLAPGATLEEAQAEMETIGLQMAADFPETNEHLRPTIRPYVASVFPEDSTFLFRAGLYSINILGVLLLGLICANVALLMFARAAARESEIAVRHALGASRGRIITQLFIEALVLGGLSTVVALSAASFGLGWFLAVISASIEGAGLPFWIHANLSPETIVYATILTVLAALIAGVVPAMKVTRGMGTRLRQASAGGGGFRFGGVWTAVIVSQIAITVVIPVIAYAVREDAQRIANTDVGVAESQYLTARMEIDWIDTTRAFNLARLESSYRELEQRLMKDPAVMGVTYADHLPRMYHPSRLIELDDGPAAPLNPAWPAYRVSSASVAPDYFEVMRAPIFAGRGFRPVDVGGAPGEEPGVIVVNQSFVKLVLGGRNPIGRRVRYLYFEESGEPYVAGAGEPGPWYEIIGVAPDMGMVVGAAVGSDGTERSSDEVREPDPKIAGFYHPVAPGIALPMHLSIHLAGNPAAFTPRLRALATAVDPSLRLYEITPMDHLSDDELNFHSFIFGMVMIICGLALALSLAGIYAVMAFTVAQRTREIGIRTALGASRSRLILGVFRKPLIQVMCGIAGGMGILVAVEYLISGRVGIAELFTVLGYSALMLAVCLIACIVPTRRALSVEPTEALRAEG